MDDYRNSDLTRLLVRRGLGATAGTDRARNERPAERGAALYAGVGRVREERGNPAGETDKTYKTYDLSKSTKSADAEAPASWVTTRAMTNPTPGSAGRVLQLVIDNSRDGRRQDPTKRTAPRSLRPSLVLVSSR